MTRASFRAALRSSALGIPAFGVPCRKSTAYRGVLTVGARSDGLVGMPPATPERTTNRLLAAVVIFLTGAALKLAAPVVIALLLTVLLVYLIDPLVVLLNTRLRLRFWLAALIAIVFFAAIFAGIGVLIFFDLPHFARSFPRFQEEILARAQGMLEGTGTEHGVHLRHRPVRGAAHRSRCGRILMSIARSSLRILSEFTLIFFFAIILLLGKYRVIRTILTVFPRRHSMVPIMLKHIDRHLRAFLGIKALASLIIGIGTALILVAFRVEFAVTWGFLTILLNFIPTLGPITAVALPSLITTIQFPGYVMSAGRHREPRGPARDDFQFHRAEVPRGATRPFLLRDLSLPVFLGLDVGRGGRPARRARHRLHQDRAGTHPRHLPPCNAPRADFRQAAVRTSLTNVPIFPRMDARPWSRSVSAFH